MIAHVLGLPLEEALLPALAMAGVIAGGVRAWWATAIARRRRG